MRFTAAKRACDGDGDNKMVESGGESPDAESGNKDLLEGDEEITFLYEVGEGVAHRSYGLNVARLARIPRRVLDVAAKKSRELEDEIKKRRLGGATRLLMDVLGNGPDQLDHLVSSIQQL
ncbi:hypothetical protein O1611_g5873 [Lasiodiplodia mahajangana]|uniref:Uncharacterized protein n=1 Tax=Lasiodiplodia mahajangana TaxID=1108764 RepID=A0ACC2JJR1_9PEZI|nr:hypothetical protein O1611_g5873 [Lasiodiplodia mahajangana]